MGLRCLKRAVATELKEGGCVYLCDTECLIFYYYSRYNSQGHDLNRNFPDYFKQNVKRPQPETEAVKEWIRKIQFVLSGSLHGGALVASYPFDNSPNSRKFRSIIIITISITFK